MKDKSKTITCRGGKRRRDEKLLMVCLSLIVYVSYFNTYQSCSFSELELSFVQLQKTESIKKSSRKNKRSENDFWKLLLASL